MTTSSDAAPEIPPDPDHPFADLAQRLWKDTGTDRAGTTLGPFQIQRLLGVGAFGEVWLAEDTRLNRRVALKIPHPGWLLTPEGRHRFVREARAASLLDHAHLVPILEVGEVDGCCYLASTYIPGPTLERWLAMQGGVVPVRMAAEIVIDLAGGMEHAHGRGVLHCDLKPANILMQSRSESPVPIPRITDFGLARLLDEDPAKTRTYLVVGTPQYMSPEQARGLRRTLDVRTDIYALGAILYELLTGRPPIVGESEEQIRHRILTEEPTPPDRLRPQLPVDLQAVCLRCLEKSPEKRYERAGDLADDLVRFCRGEPTRARPLTSYQHCQRWIRRRPATTILLLLSALSLAMMAGISLIYSHQLGQLEQKAKNAQTLADLNEFHALLQGARQRTNQYEPGWTVLNRRDLARAAQLAQTEEQKQQVRSELARAALSIDLLEPRLVAAGFQAHAMVFHPLGKWLALGENIGNGVRPRVWIVDVRSGEVRHRLSVPAGIAWQLKKGKNDGIRGLVFSPDGRWLVAGSRSGRLHYWDTLDFTVPVRSWPAHKDQISALAFSPDGKWFYSSSTDHLAYSWQINEIQENGESKLSWKSINKLVGFPEDVEFGIDSKGRRVFVGFSDRLYYFDPALKPPRSETPIVQGGKFVAMSNNGDFFIQDNRLKLQFVDTRTFVILAYLSTPGILDAHDCEITSVALHPKNHLLASASRQDGRIRLWDLSNCQLLLELPPLEGTVLITFSPQGDVLAVTTKQGVLVYPIADSLDERLAIQAIPHQDVAVSPAETYLASIGDMNVSATHYRRVGIRRLLDQKLLTEFQLKKGAPFQPRLVFQDERYLAWVTNKGINVASLNPIQLYDELQHSESDDLTVGANKWWLVSNRTLEARRLTYDPSGKSHPFTVQPLVGSWQHRPTGSRATLPQIHAIAVSPNVVAVGGRDGSLTLLDSKTVKEIIRLEPSAFPAKRVAISPDERHVAMSTQGGEIVVVRTSDHTVVWKAKPFRGSIEGLTFVGNNQLVAGGEMGVKFWDLKENVKERLHIPTTNTVQCLIHLRKRNALLILFRNEHGLHCWPLQELEEALEQKR